MENLLSLVRWKLRFLAIITFGVFTELFRYFATIYEI